jgi:tetraacyldisaccharide 4'-kinase
VVFLRNSLFSLGILKSKEYKVPVICVGNITVGGTGKTPHVEYVISVIKNQVDVATVSRGYKRKTSGFYEVMTNSAASDVGDEPLQIKKKFPEITVISDGNRRRAIERLLKRENKPGAVVLDDAFQHRYVKPGLSILLTDYSRLITRDYILPYGLLRESASHMKSANIIIVSKTPESLQPIDRRLIEKEISPKPYQHLFFTRIIYKDPIPVDFNGNTPQKSNINFSACKYDILLVSGIANSEMLLNYIRRFSRNLKHLEYPDHYIFKEKDIQRIVNEFDSFSVSPNKIIATTEKDAVRLSLFRENRIFCTLPLFYIPIEVGFVTKQEEESFTKIISNYVRKNIPFGSVHI